MISTDLSSSEKESYVIQKGDSLPKIALDSNTTSDLLVKCNGLDPANPVLRLGKTIKVFKGNWKLEVSKKRFKLYLYNGENLFKVYNIGIGKRETTLAGAFEIDIKKKEPTWTKDGKQIPYGSKENILGIEAPLWSETVSNMDEVTFLAFPRLAGYAEIGWSPSDQLSWEEYKIRLGSHAQRMKWMGINFYPSKMVRWETNDVK